MTGPEQIASVPLSMPVVRGIDEMGEVVEIKAPENAQEAINMRARARSVAKALNDFAGWLDDESVVLMRRDGQTVVVGPGGRLFGIGTDNVYLRAVDPGAMRAELLLAANDPALEGGSRVIALIDKAFEFIEPEPIKPYWQAKNVPLNMVEAIGGKFAAIVQKHRGKVVPREVLKEKR